MTPRQKRRVAFWSIVISIAVGWPLSWYISELPEAWFKRLVTFLSFVALTVTFIVWHTDTDIRTQQEDPDDKA